MDVNIVFSESESLQISLIMNNSIVKLSVVL